MVTTEVFHSTEDAPAPMALHSFKTRVIDGKIHVTANPANTLKNNLARQPTLHATGVDSSGRGTVIVGGGSGAFHAVESLREVSVCHSLILTVMRRTLFCL